MGFVIFDCDEELLAHYLEVLLVSAGKKSFADLLITSKRLIFICEGTVSIIWHCEITECGFIPGKCCNCTGGYVKLICTSGEVIVESMDISLIYRHISKKITTPGIAQIVAKSRQNDTNKLILSDIAELKEMADELISLSNRIRPIIKPINCALDEIVSMISPESIKALPQLDDYSVSKGLVDKVNDILDLLLLLDRTGAVLLIDLYCIVKRSIGHVSPRQLLDASSLIKSKYKLVDLAINNSKKILAIVRDDFDQQLHESIRSIREFSFGISISQYSAICDISTLLAEYQLNVAEANGYVMRDQSLHGIRYYVIFKTVLANTN